MDRPTFLAALAGTTVARADPGATPPRAFDAQERRGRGRLGVAAIDLADGRRFGRRGGERFPLASTFKLLLVSDVLARVDRGAERLDRPVRYTAGDIIAYSPVAGAQPNGGSLSVAELCAAAIERSDNAAANLLLRTVGGPAGLTAWLRRGGDRVTRLDRTEPALNDAPAGDLRDTTTPDAMAGHLARLVRDPVLSPGSKARLFGWMRGAKTGTARIRAGVPAGWTVGDKTGTTNTAGNDVAILWPRSGAPIVLAVYLAEVRASDAERDAAIAAVAGEAIRRLRG
ncbi:MAG: Beta-lactamase [Candidatus Eremiobacteraeota bacterium]|jgi:beta-lactamase class A|nr:Beta-lactamase [Candidatus Eremiobacteraeota bacterium]